MIRHTLWAGWLALLFGMILALVLTAVRFGFPLLGEYRESLADRLSQTFGVPVSIEQLETRWNGPFPQFELRGIEAAAMADEGPDVRFKFDRLLLELNWWDSIVARAPIFQRVDASGLFVRWYQRDGRWLHLPGEGSSASPVDLGALEASLSIVLAQPEFRLHESQIELVPQTGESQRINLGQVLFENSSTRHQLSGDFSVPLLGVDTRLEFAAQLDGDIQHASTLELPFYLKLDDLGPELLKVADAELPLSELSAGAEVWGSVNQFGLSFLRGRLGVDQARVELKENTLNLVDSSTEFSLRPYSEGYQLLLRDTHIGDALGQLDFGPSQFELHRVAGELQLSRILLRSLDLELLDELLARYPLPEKIKLMLVDLAPKGEVNNIRLDLSDQERGPFLRANLVGVDIASWRRAPAVKNLTAQLELDAQSGRLDIDSREIELSFPTVYSQAQSYELAQGRLNWRIRDEAVELSSGPLQLVHEQFAADGAFSINLPFDPEQQSFLKLMIGLQGAKAESAALLTPDVLPGTEKVQEWVARAIQAGQVDEAGLIVHAPTRALEGRPAPSVELYVAARDVNLDYQAPWPELLNANSFTHMRQGEVRVDLSQAQILNSQAGPSVLIKPQGKNELFIWGQVEGDLVQVDQLLRSDPLAATAGKSLDDWQLAGAHRSLVKLGIALDRSYAPRVRVQAGVNEGIFASEKQRLALTNIEGTLVFDTRSGLSARGVDSRFLGRAAKVDINSSAEQGTEVQFSGRWGVEPLLEWGRIPLKSFISGEIPLNGRLKLCRVDQCRSSLVLESNMAGTQVNGPEAFALETDQTSRLSVELDLGSPLLLAVNYADRLRASMQLGEVLKAHFRLGGGAARIPQTAGFKVDGQLDELELGELFSFIATLNSTFNKGGNGSLPLDLDLGVGALTAGPLVLDQVEAQLSQLGSEMQVLLSGPKVEGLVSWSREQPAYRIALNRMHLRVPKTESTQVREGADVDPERTSQTLFDAVPALDFDVADLRWNEAALGRWRGSMRRIGQSVELSALRGEMQDLELNGNASWILADTELTQINLGYQGKDLGNTLVSLDEARLIETESLSGRIALAWEAAPWQFAGRYMYGNLKFSTGKGRLLEASGGTGLLRLFGILNFNNLVRRLQLDFTDLFAKGVVFDGISGDFLIQDGIASSVKPMEMKGPSAGMLANGDIDLGSKRLNMQVNVTLPLVSNTPLAAVLLGAPQVAGALFLIDKLIGDKIEKATSIAYKLSGGWDSPELNLMNSTDKKANQ